MRTPGPIRVLQVNSRSDVGGGAAAFNDWLEELDLERVTVIAVAPDQEPWFPRLRARLGTQAYALPIRTLRPDIVPRLVRIIRRHDIQLVHTHGKAAGIHGRLAAFACRLPTVHHLHGLALDHLPPLVRTVYLRMERWLCRRTNCIVNVSASERAAALRRGLYAAERSCVIPYGIKLERFRLGELHDMAASDSGLPTVICVARLAYQKAPDVALAVFRAVVDRVQGARLLWVGDGELRTWVHRLAADLDLAPHIAFLGTRHDVPELLQRARVFLTTARWEGLPIAALEAMATGLPVVASRVTGNEEAVVEGETGFLVAPHDRAGLAARVAQVLEDPGLARRMGGAGRARVEREFAIGPVTRQLETLYESLLRARPRA